MKKLLYILLFVSFSFFGQDHYSLSFDGFDYVILGENHIINGESDFTVSFKLKNPSSYYFNGDGMILMHASNGHFHFVYNAIDDNVRFGIKDNMAQWHQIESSHTLSDWVSYSGTYSSIENQIKLYKDGLLISSLQLNTGDFFESPEHPNIQLGGVFQGGNGPLLERYQGLIDEVRIWQRELTYDEIILNLYCETNLIDSTLVGYWNLNEGSGDTVYDISGNGNHGYIYGAT